MPTTIKSINNIDYDLAPIVLFVYNRLKHTIKTIEALQKNELAHYSWLIIYADAPKHVSDNHDVLSVRNYIKSIDGFKKVTIFERKEKWGLLILAEVKKYLKKNRSISKRKI